MGFCQWVRAFHDGLDRLANCQQGLKFLHSDGFKNQGQVSAVVNQGLLGLFLSRSFTSKVTAGNWSR